MDENGNLTGETNTPWGTGLLGAINNLGTTAGSIYSAVRGGNRPAAAAPAAPAWQKYLPWAIGGLVLLVIVGLVFRGK